MVLEKVTTPKVGCVGMLLIGACAAGAGAFQVHNGALPVLSDVAGRACCSARLSHRTALQNVDRGRGKKSRFPLRMQQAEGAAGVAVGQELYCLHVRISVKEEFRQEFLSCIAANQRGTLASEPLAVSYLFGEDENERNRFHFFEAYKGRAGFEAHTRTPHFADWQHFVDTKQPLAAPPVVCFYKEHVSKGETTRFPTLTASHYCLHVGLNVKPERRQEFLRSIQANLRSTRTTEPLVVSYLYGEDDSRENTFYLFEAYKGRTGFEAHLNSQHFADWTKFVATDPFESPPQLDFYTSCKMQ